MDFKDPGDPGNCHPVTRRTHGKRFFSKLSGKKLVLGFFISRAWNWKKSFKDVLYKRERILNEETTR